MQGGLTRGHDARGAGAGHPLEPGRRRLWPRGLASLGALALAAGAVTGVGASTTPAHAAVTGDLQITGHGYGHGRGLGQWGAYGYAVQYGWSSAQIVAHYYGGTTLGSRPNSAVTVQLTAQDGRDLVVSSGAPFHVGGLAVGAGSAARVQALPDGTFHVWTSYGCGAPEVWDTVLPAAKIVSDVGVPSSPSDMLSVCGANGTKQYRGQLAVVSTSGGERTVDTVLMEDYLRGVVPRESPASWGDAGGGKGAQALQAQAIAARSYAYAEARSSYAQTCDTTACQVYGGAGSNGASIEDRRTDAAVAATAGQVLLDAGGRTVRAEFSSSTGGYTAGGAFPAVVDDGDASSPYHTWSTSVPAATLASAFGVGTLTDVAVTGRTGQGDDGGRVTSVRIQGTIKTVSVTGDAVRSALGLRSNWFTIEAPVHQQPVVYAGSSNTPGASAAGLSVGDGGDRPLSCDWNGDGIDTPGVFRSGTWFLTDTPGSNAVDVSFAFGQAGDQPVCGDWDGDGTDTPGVYRNGVVYLRNSNTTGRADGAFAFGSRGDVLLAGDWNGDRYDTVGVWRQGVFYLADSNLRPVADHVVRYGGTADAPVTGDWNGDGVDTVGVFRTDTFYLRNSNADGTADLVVPFGAAGDAPLTGRWRAGTPDTVGVARNY